MAKVTKQIQKRKPLMEDEIFINEVKKFRKNRILKEEIRELIKSEEETKLKLINPFLKILGYDVEEPGILVSEDIADFRGKKGKKVDYIAYKQGRPIMLIEAKYHRNKLCHSTEQLDSYFNTKVREGCHLALLTNGVEYRFFADLEVDNTLDEEPFFIFDLRDFNDKDIQTLQFFIYEKIDTDCTIPLLGKKLKHYNKVLETLKKEIENPSDALIALFVKEISGRSRITPNLTEEFRGHFKEAFDEIIHSMQNTITHIAPKISAQISSAENNPDSNFSTSSSSSNAGLPNATSPKSVSSTAGSPKPAENYTEEEHLRKVPENIANLYKIIRAEILKLDNSISVLPKKQSIAFIAKKTIADFVIQQNKLKVYINLKYSEINDYQNKIRDVSNIGTWGVGDCEFIWDNIQDIDYLLSFIKQSYNKNK